MSIEDLQHRISAEPGRLPAPPAPVEAVIGRARAVRARRRATRTAALAVVAVAGVATPVLAGAGPWRDGSAAGGGAAVSVNPPKVDKHGGTVFSGSADGKKWSVSVAAGGCATGDGDLFDYCLQGRAAGQGAAADLASTVQTYTSAPIKYRIGLRADVARADVDLTDGERLSLTPAKILDTPMAAFEVPRRVGISRVTAYGADGRVVAYSIAYQSPTDAQLAMWYRPDETPTQPLAAGTITATVKGVPANVEVHTGPFGICYTIQHPNSPDDKKKVPNTTCQPLPSATTPAPPASPDRGPMGDNLPSNAPWWVALGGLVDNGVDHVDFALSTGTFRVSTVRIGGFSFAVCIVAFGTNGFTMIGRTFYDASGHVLSYEPSPVK